MNTFSINSLTEEDLWEIEDSFSGIGEKSSGVDKEGKNEHKGPKTSREVDSFNKENAEKNRAEQSQINLKKDLEHFPSKNLSEGRAFELIQNYSDWVGKSLQDKYPFFTNIDKEIEYIQTRSSGPGGQNVNKTSTAVIAKHLLTGMFSRSEDSRDMIVNKRNASSKLFSKLEEHIKSWGIYLKNVPVEKRQERIVSFVKDIHDKKTN